MTIWQRRVWFLIFLKINRQFFKIQLNVIELNLNDLNSLTIWQRCVYCSRCDKRRKRRRRSLFWAPKKIWIFFLFWTFFFLKKIKVARIAPFADAFCSAEATNLFTWSAGRWNDLVVKKRECGEKWAQSLSICISIGWLKKENKNKRIWMNGSRWKVIDGSMKRDDLMNEWLAGRISSSFDVRRKVGAACREKNGRCGSRRESSGVDRPPLSMIWFIFVLMRWNLIELMWPSGNAVY